MQMNAKDHKHGCERGRAHSLQLCVCVLVQAFIRQGLRSTTRSMLLVLRRRSTNSHLRFRSAVNRALHIDGKRWTAHALWLPYSQVSLLLTSKEVAGYSTRLGLVSSCYPGGQLPTLKPSQRSVHDCHLDSNDVE